MKFRLVILALSFVMCMSIGVTVRAATTEDATGEYIATAFNVISATAERFRAPLVGKQDELERRINEVKAEETAVTQTSLGDQINNAVGAPVVKPSRPAGTPTDTLKRIGLQMYWLAVIGAIFILDHKVILYIILGLIAFKILYLLYRAIFTRSA